MQNIQFSEWLSLNILSTFIPYLRIYCMCAKEKKVNKVRMSTSFTKHHHLENNSILWMWLSIFSLWTLVGWLGDPGAPGETIHKPLHNHSVPCFCSSAPNWGDQVKQWSSAVHRTLQHNTSNDYRASHTLLSLTINLMNIPPYTSGQNSAHWHAYAHTHTRTHTHTHILLYPS